MEFFACIKENGVLAWKSMENTGKWRSDSCHFLGFEGVGVEKPWKTHGFGGLYFGKVWKIQGNGGPNRAGVPVKGFAPRELSRGTEDA